MKIWYFLVTNVLTYSYGLHGFLGNITCNNLEHNTKNYIANILENEDCSVASTWADRVKRTKKYLWTKKYHYIQLDICKNNYTKLELQEYCPNNACIFSGLTNFIRLNIFSELNTLLTSKEKIKMILHLLQDLFQPLHVYGLYKGGNDLELIRNKNGRNKTVNLHYVYDYEFPNYFIKNYHINPIEIQFKQIKNIDDYENNLINIINDNIMLSCNIYKKLGNSRYIIFEEFFDPQFFKNLFVKYLSFSISVLE
ncbi:MAG: hypothetical protein RLZZ546_1840, partial [Bacteroidota bacterium]